MTHVEARPLPAGASLLHIGLPKTGTTAVQASASRLRAELLAQGVCYPGAALNHGRASNALMGRSTAVFEAGDLSRWKRIARERWRHPEAIGWLSYEQIVQAETDVARRFLEELGPELHVAITVRAYVPMFASAWQQWVKDAGDVDFGAWLAAVTAVRTGRASADGPEWAEAFWRRHDLAAIAARWAALVGPERVHVVVLDKARPALLFDAFEGLLGLTPGTLASVPRDPLLDNRSLSRAEAELVQEVNRRALGAPTLDRALYYRVMRNGAVATMLRHRKPSADEGTMAVPRAAAEVIAAEGAAAARRLADLGVDVLGDAAMLADAPASPPATVPSPHTAVDPDLAAHAVVGAISSALGAGVSFAGGRPGIDSPHVPPSRRAVVAELRRRALPGGAR
ncbi:hypothetical protein [Demequina gelatinilytica]|uniref:hypothetical protein n=1 Tax=Demequina gelatinilytica TaxID=1638980 RepID=UPI0007857D96|nr:hypothetical protein [Demequina gelatinilytica]